MLLIDRIVGKVSPQRALARARVRAERGDHRGGIRLLAAAAAAGIAEAEFRLGQHYLAGQAVPVSRTEALRWLERAGSQGHVDAQSTLAALYVRGPAADAADGASMFDSHAPHEPDFAAAERCARRAADAGSADGQAILGYILTNGPDEMRDLEAAHGWYERASAAGSPQGALGYALSLTARVRDEAGRAQVVEHLTRAAHAGLPTAFYLLAVLTEKGVGVPRDAAAAAQFYRQAAERGNRNGQARWGLALMDGIGVEPDPDAGESWLRRAALAGDTEAAALVGDLYAKPGGALPPNYAEAALWFRRAAEAGHTGAMRALGQLYLTGAGVARDAQEGETWMRRSAEAGDRLAQGDFANMLLRGLAGSPQGGIAGSSEDLIRTRQWFEEAALAGDLTAAFNYGICLAEGVGVERNDAQAAEWLRRAAEGVVDAQFWYGKLLGVGRGVAADPAQARQWITRAADQGMLEAVVTLADMMVNGIGGPRDHVGAFALFERAARKGHVGAMFAFGAMHGGGHDVPLNRTEAQRWFRAAAERGHGHAQMMLGRYLARGLTGTPDPVEARVWTERAVAQGVAGARADLAALPPPVRERAERQALSL